MSYADKQKFSFEGHRNKKESYYPNMIRFNGSSNLTSEKKKGKRENNHDFIPPNGSSLSKIHRKSRRHQWISGFRIRSLYLFHFKFFIRDVTDGDRGGIITREHREEVDRGNLFSIEASEEIRMPPLLEDRKPNPVYHFYFPPLSLLGPSGNRFRERED